MIRVLVVDDSFFVRKIVRTMFSSDPTISVIGEAGDGDEAFVKVEELNPDVVCLDLVMPGTDGLSVLSKIMSSHPTPVVLFSSLSGVATEVSQAAFKLGVVDVVQKPSFPEEFPKVKEELLRKIRAAACVDRKKLGQIYGSHVIPGIVETNQPVADSVVAIGCPVVRPMELEELLGLLPKDIPSGIVVFHNMHKDPFDRWVERMKKSASMPTKIAEDGDCILPGRILFSPVDAMLEINALSLGGVIQVVDRARRSTLPIDLLLETAAQAFGEKMVGVILSGMKEDGIEGLRAIRKYGGKSLLFEDATLPNIVRNEQLAQPLRSISQISHAIKASLQP